MIHNLQTQQKPLQIVLLRGKQHSKSSFQFVLRSDCQQDGSITMFVSS